jgi:hypothetical protein
MPHDPPAVVSFDAAGTLIHLAEPVGVTYARVAAEHGVSADPAAICRALRLGHLRAIPQKRPTQQRCDARNKPKTNEYAPVLLGENEACE